MDIEQRKRYTRFHSRGVPTHWLVLDGVHTYRSALGADPAPGERLVFETENNLLGQGYEPNPPRDVPAAVYPRSA